MFPSTRIGLQRNRKSSFIYYLLNNTGPTGSDRIDLRALIVTAGWDEQQHVVLHIPADRVLLHSLLSGDFPSGIDFYNYGHISSSNFAPAILLRSEVRMHNYGTIAGQGGNGGGGQGATGSARPSFASPSTPDVYAEGAGGEGGKGAKYVITGPATHNVQTIPPQNGSGYCDTVGSTQVCVFGGSGGAGGALGKDGFFGENAQIFGATTTSFSNGSDPTPAALALSGDQYVTWINRGTILGGIE